MEHKKPRKIGLTFLTFSTIFYKFPKFYKKRKEKSVNSAGPEAAQAPQFQGKVRAPAPALRTLQKGPWLNE